MQSAYTTALKDWKDNGGEMYVVFVDIYSPGKYGEWGALEVITDPYRLKKQGMIEVTTYETCDINVRHPQAFAAATDINPTA